MNETPFDKIVLWVERNPRITILYFIIVLLLIFFCIPLLITQISLWFTFDSSTGVMGDTIGGITGPLIGLIAATLTFFAFWIQFKANQQQRFDISIERFESIFFEMLRLHKGNLNDIVIEGYEPLKKLTTPHSALYPAPATTTLSGEITPKLISGRQFFVDAVAELEALYYICEATLTFDDIPNKDEYLIKLSYRLFFHGIDYPGVSSIDSSVNGDNDFVKKCKERLADARHRYETSGGSNIVYRFPQSNIKIVMSFKFTPFSGYTSRLSHYFRQLYLLVKYVSSKTEREINESEKLNYLRMVRAQLSEHEQLMLYFNYLSGYGDAWENDNHQFFSRYKMIHNLPFELTTFTINPHTRFKKKINELLEKGIHMFEHDEHGFPNPHIEENPDDTPPFKKTFPITCK